MRCPLSKCICSLVSNGMQAWNLIFIVNIVSWDKMTKGATHSHVVLRVFMSLLLSLFFNCYLHRIVLMFIDSRCSLGSLHLYTACIVIDVTIMILYMFLQIPSLYKHQEMGTNAVHITIPAKKKIKSNYLISNFVCPPLM